MADSDDKDRVSDVTEPDRTRERITLHRVLHDLNAECDDQIGAVLLLTMRRGVGANLTTILADHTADEEHRAIGHAIAACLRQAADMTESVLVAKTVPVAEVDVDENGVPIGTPTPKGQVH